MMGMFFDVIGSINVEAAVDEYVSTWHSIENPKGDIDPYMASWHKRVSGRTELAQSIEQGKGIPKEVVMAYLEERFGAPEDMAAGFDSPAQRKWFFATQEDKAKPPKTKKPEDRWREIMEAAKNAVRLQPEMTSSELVSAVNSSVEPELTDSETGRVEKLVGPTREHKLVGPPEEIPEEERTPEIDEAIEKEWERIQEEREQAKERTKEPEPIEKKKSKEKEQKRDVEDQQMGKPKDKLLPAFIQPGNFQTSAAKKSSREFLVDDYDCLVDGAGWSAFGRAVSLIRGGVEDKLIKEDIEETYPEADCDEVVKAAKGFVKQGSRDPYIGGRLLAEKLVSRGVSVEATLSNLKRSGVNSRYLAGFEKGVT